MADLSEIARASSALFAVPSDLPRDDWVKAGMAAQAAGLDFQDFDKWSAQASNYDARAARQTWRSFKPGKGVSAATLFHMARAHGWQDEAPRQRPLPAPSRPAEPPRKPRPGMAPADVWARCTPATFEHGYIAAKACDELDLSGLRVVPEGDSLTIAGQRMAGALVVPAYGPQGELQSLQFIPPPGAGRKLNLPGASMAGASFTVGELAPGGTAYLVEGIGQGWACWHATGNAAVVAFGWGNVATVARELRQKDSAARLVLVPDVGKEEAAHAIARELGCAVATMPQGEANNFDACDLAQRDGLPALAAVLATATEPAPLELPPPLLAPVSVLDVLTNPAPPPRFIWDGYLPAGTVSLLGAHGGTGKSTVALMLAVAVATGRPLFGVDTLSARVLFVSLEDSAAVVRHRLATICRAWDVMPEELAQLSIVDGTTNPELFAGTGRDGGITTATYSELRAQAQGAGLVVIDNASDAFGGDEIQRRQVRAFIRALAAIATDNDAAVLVLAHVDKITSRARRAEGGEGYSGSTAWHNSVRSRLFMSRDNAGMLEIEHQKANLSRLREPLLLTWPDGGLPQLSHQPQGIVGHIADRVHTQALLRLIHEYTERGERVSAAITSRTHAARLLAGEPTYPQALKDRQVFDLLRDAERMGWLVRASHRGSDRHPRECWEVTPQGREAAGILSAATAATSDFKEVTAPAAKAAATAATSR